MTSVDTHTHTRQVIAAVGLAQNLAALRALATEVSLFVTGRQDWLRRSRLVQLVLLLCRSRGRITRTRAVHMPCCGADS